MTAEKHNGWTNYETWSVNLILTNDQGSYNYWQEVAQECLDDTQADDNLGERREAAAGVLAERLKDEIEEGNPLKDDTTLYAQLLTAAISEANWYEIAASWLEDLEPAETE